MADSNWSDFHGRLHRRLKTPRPGSRPSAKPSFLLPQQQAVLIAVSGGQDSVALAGLLAALRPKWSWQLAIAHCNHRWNPVEDEAAAEVEQLAQSLRLPFFLRVADEPPQGETGARRWRYAQLEQIAQQAGFDAVVTGHTASDRAQTLLYNLARGSGLDGLASLGWQRPFQFESKTLTRAQQATSTAKDSSPAGLPSAARAPSARPLQLVRPLLGFTRAETAKICEQLGLAFWQDPVNQDLSYARNRLRHRVLPELVAQTNPRAAEHLAQTAELLAADIQYLERQAQTLRQRAETSTGLNRRMLKDAPLALQRRAVRQFLRQRLPQQPNMGQIEKLVGLFQAPQGSQTDPFPGGSLARVVGDWVVLEPPEFNETS